MLIREVPFHLGFRLWDTYLAEGPRMKEFLVYVLASFLLHWARSLTHMDFQVSFFYTCKAKPATNVSPAKAGLHLVRQADQSRQH